MEAHRPEADVMPRGVAWIKSPAADVDPQKRAVILESGAQVGYDTQAVVPGLQLHLDSVEVMISALE